MIDCLSVDVWPEVHPDGDLPLRRQGDHVPPRPIIGRLTVDLDDLKWIHMDMEGMLKHVLVDQGPVFNGASDNMLIDPVNIEDLAVEIELDRWQCAATMAAVAG